MKIKILLLGCLTLGASLAVASTLDEDVMTLDETTTLVYETKSQDEDSEITHEGCTTTRGLLGSCMTIRDCYPNLLPPETQGVDQSTRTYNQALAEILVNVSGFCAGDLEARSEISPTVFSQVMRSEVMLCCPSPSKSSLKTYKLDAASNETADGELFRGKSCGYLKIDKTKLEEINEKIVKGRKTKPGEFPWAVAMMNRGRQFCGGSLLNEKTVLTAAHCVQHMTASDVKNLRLQIGDHDIYKVGEVTHVTRSASKVLFHKGFSMKHLQHDIALIHLDKPVTYTDNIQPVCIHPGNPPFEGGKSKADVAGWGALSEGGSQPSDLRAVRVRVITKAECKQKYTNSANKVTDGMICAGSDNGEDSCQGDSGGPLTTDSRDQAKQIGVVSWGIGCGRFPGVYTAVYKYQSWINKNLA